MFGVLLAKLNLEQGALNSSDSLVYILSTHKKKM